MSRVEGGSGIGEHPFIFIRNTVSFTRLHLGLDLQLELGSYLSSIESDKFSSTFLSFFFRSSHHPGFSYTIILQYYLVIEKEQAHICSFLYAFLCHTTDVFSFWSQERWSQWHKNPLGTQRLSHSFLFFETVSYRWFLTYWPAEACLEC